MVKVRVGNSMNSPKIPLKGGYRGPSGLCQPLTTSNPWTTVAPDVQKWDIDHRTGLIEGP